MILVLDELGWLRKVNHSPRLQNTSLLFMTDGHTAQKQQQNERGSGVENETSKFTKKVAGHAHENSQLISFPFLFLGKPKEYSDSCTKLFITSVSSSPTRPPPSFIFMQE